jgi:hypothetical protein
MANSRKTQAATADTLRRSRLRAAHRELQKVADRVAAAAYSHAFNAISNSPECKHPNLRHMRAWTFCDMVERAFLKRMRVRA